jgi:predicted nucleic acid-binding protein
LIVCLDATALMCLLDTRVNELSTPDGTKVGRMQERMEHMIASVDEDKGSAVAEPTPALSELLVGAGTQRATMLRALESRRSIRIVPFDKMAAIHCASLDAQAISEGDKRDGLRSSWQKVKIDRQIVAIAQVARCGRILTGDPDVEKIAGRAAIEATFVWDLELPPEDAQHALQLDMDDEPPVD